MVYEDDATTRLAAVPDWAIARNLWPTLELTAEQKAEGSYRVYAPRIPSGFLHLPRAMPAWRKLFTWTGLSGASEEEEWQVRMIVGQIVVLRADGSNDGGAFNGTFAWFLRGQDNDGRELHQIPAEVCKYLLRVMRNTPSMAASTMVRLYANPRANFQEAYAIRAFERYERVYSEAHGFTSIDPNPTQARSSPKRRRVVVDEDDDVPLATRPAAHPECVVCLEPKPKTHRGRCHNPKCTIHVCDHCHVTGRGLCPICDRTALNMKYECGCCAVPTSLADYGHACIDCGAHTLCSGCFKTNQVCMVCSEAHYTCLHAVTN
jgi:hypothetical protein